MMNFTDNNDIGFKWLQLLYNKKNYNYVQL